jgi:DTW domain-containing protein YfiP
MLLDYCLCELVGNARESRPQIFIVRHQWEAFKSTGTARLAGLALANASVVDMAAENPEPVRERLRDLEDAWLLYPGHAETGPLREPPRTLVVLDGTWRQTRKMLRRLPELARLPRFSLPPDASGTTRDRLREAPRPGARSTLESIAEALGTLESPETGRWLLELHAEFVARTRHARGQRYES